MKYHEIDLKGFYLSLYTTADGDIESVEIKKRKPSADEWLQITLNNIYSEDVIE